MIIGIIIGLLIGGIIVFLICNPKNQQIININKENELYNNKVLKEIEDNKLLVENLQNQSNALNQEYQENSKRLLEFIEDTDSKISEYAKNQIENKRKEFDLNVESWKREFVEIKTDMINSYLNQEKEYNISIEELKLAYEEDLQKINNLSSIINAAIEASKRAEEIKLKADFYKLQLSDLDIEEIAKLRTVEPFLRDATPLNKVIYKYYYENAYTSLVGRVIGRNVKKSGIYKITNIQNNMCYIGQARDISERWREHIKKGVGADTPNKNKLYPALKSIGVENFTFEVIEECEIDKLDEREKFWIDFYKCTEFGYNVKRGNG